MSNDAADFEQQTRPSILDAVSHAKQANTLRSFNPQRVVFELLDGLEDREREIVVSRYGLTDGDSETLEKIGGRFDLTRERVRQIEKEAIKKLRKLKLSSELVETTDLIQQILEEGGDIATEQKIIDTLLSAQTGSAEQAILFILNFSPQFKQLRENKKYNASWYVSSFDKTAFDELVEKVVAEFKDAGKVLTIDELYQSFSSETTNQETLENLFLVSKKIDQNIYNEWGIATWAEIHPKDVGDKAYLVLAHHGEPEHYEAITEMINRQKFDSKTAHKETVHNELIKDNRFVLVGRGIYALKEWGYKRGTVADIIVGVLKEAGEPLTKDEIIEEVLKQRVVKRNTVVVGLSDKDKFKKLPDGHFVLAAAEHTTTNLNA